MWGAPAGAGALGSFLPSPYGPSSGPQRGSAPRPGPINAPRGAQLDRGQREEASLAAAFVPQGPSFPPPKPLPPRPAGTRRCGGGVRSLRGGRLPWTLLPAGVPPPNFLQPGPDRDPVAAVAADVANARVAAARNHPDPASAPPSRWGRGLSGGGACGNLREGLEAAGCGSWSRA